MKTYEIILMLITSLFLLSSCQGNPLSGKCEPITLSMCEDIQYEATKFPNRLGHNSQNDAGQELNHFYPLVKVNCSPNLKLFLCAVYVPKCSAEGNIIPPCRHLCQQAQDGCLSLMMSFDFAWPEKLRCEKFPVQSEDVPCVSPDAPASPALKE